MKKFIILSVLTFFCLALVPVNVEAQTKKLLQGKIWQLQDPPDNNSCTAVIFMENEYTEYSMFLSEGKVGKSTNSYYYNDGKLTITIDDGELTFIFEWLTSKSFKLTLLQMDIELVYAESKSSEDLFYHNRIKPYENQNYTPVYQNYGSYPSSSSGSSSTQEKCFACYGSGQCPVCKGSGYSPAPNYSGSSDPRPKCNNCYGNGICPKCKGSGLR